MYLQEDDKVEETQFLFKFCIVIDVGYLSERQAPKQQSNGEFCSDGWGHPYYNFKMEMGRTCAMTFG